MVNISETPTDMSAVSSPLPMAMNENTTDNMEPEDDPGQQEFIAKWIKKIDSAKKHHEESFKRMREDILFGAGVQWDGQTPADKRYVADITQRIISGLVATLYAKNPTVVAQRRKRMDFMIWDGDQASLQAAMQNPNDPMNAMLIEDVMQGARTRQKLDGVAKTLEIVFREQLDQQQPNFKRQMKQLVRRTISTGVGYLRLDYHRAMSVQPEIETRIADLATRLSQIKALMTEQQDGDYGDCEAEAEQLRINIQTLEQQKFALIREGLQVSFPRSTALIIDEDCTQLEGFVGARWLAEEFYMSEQEILRVSGKKIKDAEMYSPENLNNWKLGASTMTRKKDGEKAGYYCCYMVFDLDTFSSFMICRGYKQYLIDPATPDVTLDRFFPYFALTFNDREDENCIYPHSTIRLMMHQQKEYNRAKEALRIHRIASNPLYASGTGALSEADKGNIAEHEPHHCVELQTLQDGQDVATKFQMVKKHPIDPNVYETNSIFVDIGRVVGVQAADLGATSGITATESSLAADSRTSSMASNSDDLDDFLSAFVKEAGHVILMQFDIETVKGIAGPGAVWPQFSGPDIMKDIYLDIEAGSSGRPNKVAEAAALERLYPLIIQLQGVNPEWIVKKAIGVIDDNVDIADAYLAGIPSIMAQNRMAQASTGDPATDPNAQGAQGGANQPGQQPGAARGLRPNAGPQPAMPSPTPAAVAPQRAGGMMA